MPKHRIEWIEDPFKDTRLWASAQSTAGASFANDDTEINGMTVFVYIRALIERYHGYVTMIWYNGKLIWSEKDGWKDSLMAIKVSGGN